MDKEFSQQVNNATEFNVETKIETLGLFNLTLINHTPAHTNTNIAIHVHTSTHLNRNSVTSSPVESLTENRQKNGVKRKHYKKRQN